jgi:hypothetical protein
VEHVKKRISAHGEDRLDGHVVEREEGCGYAALQCEIRLTTSSDAEQPKHPESEVVVASDRRRKIGTRAGDRGLSPLLPHSTSSRLAVSARARLRAARPDAAKSGAFYPIPALALGAVLGTPPTSSGMSLAALVCAHAQY